MTYQSENHKNITIRLDKGSIGNEIILHQPCSLNFMRLGRDRRGYYAEFSCSKLHNLITLN